MWTFTYINSPILEEQLRIDLFCDCGPKGKVAKNYLFLVISNSCKLLNNDLPALNWHHGILPSLAKQSVGSYFTHFAMYCTHCMLYCKHCTLYTIYAILYRLNIEFYTLHPVLGRRFTVFPKILSVHYTMFTVLYTISCTLHTRQCTINTSLHCKHS